LLSRAGAAGTDPRRGEIELVIRQWLVVSCQWQQTTTNN